MISQFTLYADSKSRRPGFSYAAKPDIAVPLYELFMEECRKRGFHVEHGEFGADMKVASVNLTAHTATLTGDTARIYLYRFHGCNLRRGSLRSEICQRYKMYVFEGILRDAYMACNQ